MDISRTGIDIGPLTLHFYGLLIVIGILVGTGLAAWLAKKDDKDPDHIWNGLIWAVIFGIIGARLWFVFFPPITSVEAGKDTAWMLKNFFDLNDGPLAIWNGGLGIFGAVLGGLLGAMIYARRAKLANLWEWIDIAAIGLPLGHAIGRWGNYVNQELYGRPTKLPWGIHIDNPPLPYSNTEKFHPLFLYEGLWNVLLCGVLLYVWLNYRKSLKAGDFLLMYLIGYCPARFMLEFLRLETAHVPGSSVNSSQLASAIGLVIALVWFIYRHRADLMNWRKERFHPDGRPVGKPKKQKTS